MKVYVMVGFVDEYEAIHIIDGDLVQQVRGWLNDPEDKWSKVAAIKHLRTEAGLALRDAELIVDHLEASGAAGVKQTKIGRPA